MTQIQIPIQSPMVNLKKLHNDCRCVGLEIKTESDTIVLEFESIDDAKAFVHLLGISTGVIL